MILCSNPKDQYNAYKDDIDSAVKKVLESGWYVLGEEVELFEKEFAEYISTRILNSIYTNNNFSLQ